MALFLREREVGSMFGRLFRRGRPFEVFVQDGDRQIDLYPIAEEVLRNAPQPCGMDTLRIADLARQGFNGAHIRVDEYPAGIDRDYAKIVIGRVISWARWIRKSQGYGRSVTGIYKIKTGYKPCPRMERLSGKIITKDRIERLPLDDCWRICQCWYGFEFKHRK